MPECIATERTYSSNPLERKHPLVEGKGAAEKRFRTVLIGFHGIFKVYNGGEARKRERERRGQTQAGRQAGRHHDD